MSDCGLWSALKSLFRCFPPFRSTENAHRSPVVSPTLRSARCSGRGKKAGRNFLFSFLPWSFVYLFNRIYMSILDSPPPSGCSDRVGWHTSHPTSLKGESTWRGGTLCKKLVPTMRQRVNTRAWLWLMCYCMQGMCVTQVCTHDSMQSQSWWRWSIFR